MASEPDTADFRVVDLSEREREIVDLATLGLTDQQIARSMGVSTSTVNSYWVRVRGKLGPLNRTEIVSRVLRLQYEQETADLAAEVARLRGRLAEAELALGRSHRDRAGERRGSWHLLALDRVPEALLVANRAGDVVFANAEAERLLGVEPEGLVGRDAGELAVPEDPGRLIRVFLAAGLPGRLRLGVEEPCYARSPDRGDFRATIVGDGFDSPEGFMGVFLVREFLAEVDAVVQSLRRPLSTG